MRGLPKHFTLAFFVVFALFMLTRLYNLEHRITFGWDQEQFSNQIWNVVKNHTFTLLGPRTNNDLGFFLAPYFTYMLIPLYLLTNMHPFALYFFVVLMGLLFFALSYLTVSRIFSSRHALLFLFLWTFNPLAHMYDSIPWWPLYIPLGVMTVLFLFHYLHTNSKQLLIWAILGLALGFFSNMHFQFVFMIFCAALFASYEIKGKGVPVKAALVLGLGFLTTLVPLILFDIRHNFLNTQLLFNFFFTKIDVYERDMFIWIIPFTHFMKSFTVFPITILMQIMYVLMFAIMAYLFFHTKSFQKVLYGIAASLWIFTPVFFGIYGKRPSEYYFIFLMPFILLAITDFAIQKKRAVPLILTSLLLALIHIAWFQKTVQTDYAGLIYKDQVVHYIKQQTKGREFFLSYDGVSIDNGFRYLLRLRGLQVSENEMAPLIEVSLPPRAGSHVIGKYGVTIPQSLK